MLHVLGWLYEDTDDTPAMLLAAHGNRLAASRVRATANLTLKQKDGLYDGARRSLEVLDEPAYAAWVTPRPGRASASTPARSPPSAWRSAPTSCRVLPGGLRR